MIGPWLLGLALLLAPGAAAAGDQIQGAYTLTLTVTGYQRCDSTPVGGTATCSERPTTRSFVAGVVLIDHYLGPTRGTVSGVAIGAFPEMRTGYRFPCTASVTYPAGLRGGLVPRPLDDCGLFIRPAAVLGATPRDASVTVVLQNHGPMLNRLGIGRFTALAQPLNLALGGPWAVPRFLTGLPTTGDFTLPPGTFLAQQWWDAGGQGFRELTFGTYSLLAVK